MKLTNQEKTLRKLWKKEVGGVLVNTGTLTVLFVPTCRGNGKMTWSICHEGDTINRKRGEFVALRRMLSGGCVPCIMPLSQNSAFDFAVSLWENMLENRF